MPRKPIGARAMTPAERKRRERARYDQRRFDAMEEAIALYEKFEARWTKDDSPQEPDIAKGHNAFRDLIACMVFVAQAAPATGIRNKWRDRVLDRDAGVRPMKHVVFTLLPLDETGNNWEDGKLYFTARVSEAVPR